MKLVDGTEINSDKVKKARASMVSDMAKRQREYVKNQEIINSSWEYKKKIFKSLAGIISIVFISFVIQYYLSS
ncbi:Hypothetical protein SRAE_X000179700 [Strongyloides ratti]|uniref:Uncharacterized protein n=1 Tax=Strongyloides ratti TaxID=34506 RepID=A0A090MPL3_STRRB|nr:Hypothetical protein SRAE_X000179700 [Strongyloides ratti]CEF60057.1 Hypothetical protein SRAE_X000179700 [Strongyloides ratti]